MKMKLLITLLVVASLCVIAEPPQNKKHEIEVKNPWIRISAKGSNTALFFDVVNKSDKPDTLLNAESDLAELVEVHETFKKENDMMGMRKVKFVIIPPNSTVKFKPRDLHVMLINLKNDLKSGDKGKATLHFKKSGKHSFEAIVREMPGMK
jgi:hypothetical protein